MNSKTILLFVFLAFVSANDDYVKWPNYKESWLHNTVRLDSNWKKATKNPAEFDFKDFNKDFDFKKFFKATLGRNGGSYSSYMEGVTFPFWLIMLFTFLFQILAFIFFILGCVMKSNRFVCARLPKKKYTCHTTMNFFTYLLFLIFGIIVLALGIDSVSKYYKAVNVQYEEIDPFLESITILKDEVFGSFDTVSENASAVSDTYAEFLKEAKKLKVNVNKSNDFTQFENFDRDFNKNVKDSKKELPEIKLPSHFKETKDKTMYYIWMGGIVLFCTMLLVYIFRIGGAVLDITSCFNITFGGIRALYWITIISIFFAIGSFLVFISDSCAHSDSIIHSIVEHKEFKKIVPSDNLSKSTIDYYINCSGKTNKPPFFNDLSEKTNDDLDELKLQKNKFNDAYQEEINIIPDPYRREHTQNTLKPMKEELDNKIDTLVTSINNLFNGQGIGLAHLLNCKRLRKKSKPIGRAILIGDGLCKVHVEQGETISKLLIFLLTCDFLLIILGLVSACCTVEEEQEKYEFRGEVDIVGGIANHPGAIAYY